MTVVLLKVIIIGDSTVGKTSFVQKYVNGTFRRNYKATMGVDFALKVIKWSDSCNIKLQLWDIAGQERFTPMVRAYYKNAHACLIMFDLTQRHTFDSVVRWKKDLDQKCFLRDGSPIPCLLMANKCDMADNRVVGQDEIKELCNDHEFLGWSETSVKEGIMVDKAMGFLVDEMMSKHTDLAGDFTDTPHASQSQSEPVKLWEDSVNYYDKSSECSC